MTTKNEVGKEHPFIGRAQELYQIDPLAAAIMLTDGVSNILESHGLMLPPTIPASNGHFLHPESPFPTVPQQRLDAACRNLARTAQEAAAGIAPEPDEWEMDVAITRSALRLVAEVHG